MSIVLSGQKYLCFRLYLYYFIFFNFQNVTYIQNVGFPTAVLGTAPVTAATRAFTVKGGASKYYLENGLFTIHMDYIIKFFIFFRYLSSQVRLQQKILSNCTFSLILFR